MTWETSISKKCPISLAWQLRLPRHCRVLLHAANLWHGTDNFTSPLLEGMLRNFFGRKIRQLRPGLNPRTWVPEASMLTTRPDDDLIVESKLVARAIINHLLLCLTDFSISIYNFIFKTVIPVLFNYTYIKKSIFFIKIFKTFFNLHNFI
jgi:hypothetical protein